MSLFTDLKNTFSSLIPVIKEDTEIIKPESKLAKVSVQAKKLGEQIKEKVGIPLATKIAPAIPKLTFRIFEDISKVAGGLVTGGLKPQKGETITQVVERQPMISEVVKKKVEQIPIIGKIPLFPAIAGFASEILLPPYGTKTPKGALAYKRILNKGYITTPTSWGNEFIQVLGKVPKEIVGKGISLNKEVSGFDVGKVGNDISNKAKSTAFGKLKDQEYIKGVTFSDGKTEVTVNKDYLDLALKHSPESNVEFFIKDETSPLAMKSVKTGDTLGLVMPIKEAKVIPEIASTKITKPKVEEFEPEGIMAQPIPKVFPEVRAETYQAGKLHPLAPEVKKPVPIKPEKLTSETLNKPYTEPTKKAIIETSDMVGEPITTVSRVTDSLRKAKVKFIEYIQNAEVRIKNLQERKGIKITDESDPYLKMTLYHGRIGNKVEKLKVKSKEIIDSIKVSADQLGTNLKTLKKEVSDYLYYRHAPERNTTLGEGAAGITTKEAEEGLRRIESSKYAKKVKEVAEKLQKINDETLDFLLDGGIITDELYNTLKTKYKHHIPLNRIFKETEDIGGALSGRGFDVKATGIKIAKGSEREVSDIVTNILTNHEQALVRAEKNIVDQSTLAFVRNNKDVLGDLMKEVKPKMIGETFEGKPILERTQDPTILQLFENGKRIWIKIKDPHLAVAFRGVGREKLGTILTAVNKFTRLYAGLATRFNPEFFLPNKIRDLQETITYLSAQKKMGFKSAGGVVARDVESIKDVINAFQGVETEGTKLYIRMKELGGTTGGMGLSTRKNIELNIENLEKLANSKTRQIGNKLIEYVDNWNTIFEDSTRLSVFKQALKQGFSEERAAFFAKEASINFNRMGTAGPVVNALWMFSNASIQGSAKLISSLKNPKVLGAVALVVGGSVATINEWNDKVDPKWRDKVSKWDRLNGLPVVIPSADEEFRYFTIPVSWGLKPIKVMSDYAYDAIAGQDFDTKQMIEDSMSAIVDAYNPTGGTDITSALVPTIIDVPVEIQRNKSWSGIKIRPDTDPNAPKDIQYFQSLGKTKIGQGAISISETLQEKLGLAVSPADIKYAFDQYISGAGRTVGKITNIVSSFIDSDEPLPLDEYPLISRFYREKTAEEIGVGARGKTEELLNILGEQSRERFSTKQQAIELDKELQNLSKEEANKRYQQTKKENPELAEKLKDVVEERKLDLPYEEKLMKQLGVESGERAKYVDEQIMKLPTKEERNAYYKELKKKKIISDEVAKQIRKLRSE